MPLRRAQMLTAYDSEPQFSDADGTRTWIGRGANFVVAISSVVDGSVLSREDNPDEYFLLLHDCGALVEASGEAVGARANSVTIVPPGRSAIRFQESGVAVRIFSSRAEDLAAAASNAHAYAGNVDDVAPLVPWPAPPGGYRIRHYELDESDSPGSNMRLYRSSNLMVNALRKRQVPRDVTALSPHSHKDFEQGSIALEGTYVHHLRYPWGKDMTQWVDDEAIEVHSPSLAVIPPGTVHTSRNVSAGASWLIDIFAPPRTDFSNKPGLVLNEAEYPLPDVPAVT
ncbi:hypothetical protein [Paraburkholderia sp. J12]|uniref:hypothetical protein n=1 Tax=Paraburkholderia sp. J12 TaxID=2805432 RepID=UPI002ABD462D|nr:hypothetical protein [Paraburkholderia sp. J12]